MEKYIFGIDLGGTAVKIGLFNTEGEKKHAFEIPTQLADSGSSILNDITAAIEKEIAEQEVSPDDVIGIGIGVPGPVLSDGTVNKCINLGWDVFNIEERLSALTGYNVKAGNDADFAALGECWKGGGKGYKDMFMVTIGTGVGGGLIIDGKILPGSTGASGELGHCTVEFNEKTPCACGKRGCLEQYASARGGANLAKKYLPEYGGPTVLRELNETMEGGITSKELYDAAREGDDFALEITEQIADYLGRCISYVANTVNPQAFVIGGGMSKAGNILVDAITRNYRKYAFHACDRADIRLATLGNDAGMYGAVKAVLDS